MLLRPRPFFSLQLPSAESIAINMEHVLSNHTLNGEGYLQSMMTVTGSKTNFPWYMSPADVERTIRQAYKIAQKWQVGQTSIV